MRDPLVDVSALTSLKDGAAPGDEIRAVLADTWRDPPGIVGWLSAVNHKTIATRFIATTFVFFLLAGVLTLMMRTQLARADSRLIGPELYDQLFTMHGTVMMFLFAVPVMQAVASWIIPLMIGARSVAFPRMNAYAYWMFLFGGLTIFTAFVLGSGPRSGWFSYLAVHLGDRDDGVLHRLDLYADGCLVGHRARGCRHDCLVLAEAAREPNRDGARTVASG